MRDILITFIVIVGCLYTFKRPYIGVLLWSWISYMNPHRLAFGFAFDMPFAQIVAIVLMTSMIFSNETKKIPMSGIIVVWVIFILFMGLTTYLAYYPEDAAEYYLKVIKIQIITFITMMLITDIDKLRKLIWIIVLSIGFFSTKGGIYTIVTGGGGRVWGPPGGFVEDNNALAVATLMIIPLMVYLYQTIKNDWVKKGLLLAIILSLLSTLGSQSRGALLSIVAVGIFYWLKSQQKLISALVIIILAVSLLSFMPDSWRSRMETIQTYDEDNSAMGRLNAWEFAFNAANDNLFGLGFDGFRAETFLIYAPNPTHVQGAHSIYFYILGDHGWIGLILFLLIFFMAWRKLTYLIKTTSGVDELKEYHVLSKMLQISLIAYFVGGAFLNLSYFDLPWHIISFVILIESYIKKEELETNIKNELDKVF